MYMAIEQYHISLLAFWTFRPPLTKLTMRVITMRLHFDVEPCADVIVSAAARRSILGRGHGAALAADIPYYLPTMASFHITG